MTNALLSPKFQVVIPKEIRKSMNLKPGQRLQFHVVNNHIEIKPIVTGTDLIGLLKDKRPIKFEREGDRQL
jgi:AbrB family looped-hinge helix DNA binding protein